LQVDESQTVPVKHFELLIAGPASVVGFVVVAAAAAAAVMIQAG
jgi:hypothetical protein